MTESASATVIPARILTDKGGPSQRLRVDPGQTGFFAGRMFRSFLNSVIPVVGPSVQFRLTTPIDIIVWSQILTVTQGALRLEIYGGAVTPSGVWTARPVIGINRMDERPQPYYTALTTIETGGDFSGGTLLDVLMIRAGTNQGNQSSQNIGGELTERGIPTGVYFGRLATLTGGITVTDAAQMFYSLTWEERVP